MATKYSEADLAKAKQLVLDLKDFSNKDLQCVIDHKVTDKTREVTIAEILATEFGNDIINHVHRSLQMFGDPKFNSVK